MIEALEPHYRAVLKLIGHAMPGEDLSGFYPLYGGKVRSFRLSGQAHAFLNDLESSKEILARDGIRFGRSRLAVRFPEGEGDVGCSYCGMCLYGCPYDHIYSARQTLDKLLGRPGFRYQPFGSYFLLTCKLLATLIIGSKKSRELLLISHLQPEHRMYNPGVLALAENHMDKSKHQPMLRIDIPNRSHCKFNLRDGMDWRNCRRRFRPRGRCCRDLLQHQEYEGSTRARLHDQVGGGVLGSHHHLSRPASRFAESVPMVSVDSVWHPPAPRHHFW